MVCEPLEPSWQVDSKVQRGAFFPAQELWEETPGKAGFFDGFGTEFNHFGAFPTLLFLVIII